MSEHLLHQAVARGEAAGDGEMGDDVAEQADHAERAGPAAIEPRKLSDQAQRGHEHEEHIEQRARRNRCDNRDPLCRRRHQPPRLHIQRRQQFALGQPDHVGAVDDLAGMTFEFGTGAGKLRILVRNRDQLLHDGAALLAIVAGEDLGGTPMQLFDRRKPRQPKRLASDHHRERKRGDGGER